MADDKEFVDWVVQHSKWSLIICTKYLEQSGSKIKTITSIFPHTPPHMFVKEEPTEEVMKQVRAAVPNYVLMAVDVVYNHQPALDKYCIYVKPKGGFPESEEVAKEFVEQYTMAHPGGAGAPAK